MSNSQDKVGRYENSSTFAKLWIIFQFECKCSEVPVDRRVHLIRWNFVEIISQIGFFGVFLLSTIFVPH